MCRRVYFFTFWQGCRLCVLESMNELVGWKGRCSAYRRRLLLVLPAPSHCHLPSNNITWLLPDSQDAVGAPSESSDSSLTAEEGTETQKGLETPLTDSERAKSDKGGRIPCSLLHH